MDYLFIDGYNAMHAWPSLQPLLKQQQFEAACTAFIEKVRIIHDIEGPQLSIVFDGNGAKPCIENPSNEQTFTVIYSSSSISADGIIEQLVHRVKNPKQCTVVSLDNMVIESTRAAGAIASSPFELFEWVRRCEAQSIRLIKRHRSKG